ncbi:MAG: sulfatase [Myxococcota bacterium]|nr:sulfatase [Myxococcota bacterium]
MVGPLLRRLVLTVSSLPRAGACSRAAAGILAIAVVITWLTAGATASPKDLHYPQRPGSDSLAPSVATGLGPPGMAPKAGSPNVVLVTVDTWRADRLGLYGAPRPTSPWLETMAADSLVFERAVAPSSWTWPVMASLVTGLYPGRHGTVLPDSALCGEVTTLAESFHQAGWRSGFAGSNEYFEPKDSGFRQGFEYFWAAGSEAAARVLEYTGYFLEAAHQEPFFLQVHLFDPHCPYTPSEEALGRAKATPFGPTGLGQGETVPPLPVDLALQHLCHVVPPLDPNLHNLKPEDFQSSTDPQDYLDHYDAELIETDEALAKLQALLEKTGDWDTSWIVITGDHGEEFHEHGRLGHGDSLHAETTWVPLLIRPPGGLPDGGQRIEQPVSLVDLAPTLLEAVGLTVPRGLDGRSLLGLLEGRTPARRPVFSETRYRFGEAWWLIEGVGRRLLIDEGRGRAQLYDSRDSMDRNNLLDGRAEGFEYMRAAGLAGALHRERRRQERSALCRDKTKDMDPEHTEQLRSLGYTTD